MNECELLYVTVIFNEYIYIIILADVPVLRTIVINVKV